jgi:predicted  nucleic acid-binding Zn-ribbon protein
MWRFRCSRCNLKKDLPLGSTKLEKCPKCGESHFLNHYEQIYPGEVAITNLDSNTLKGGDEMAKKDKEEKVEKPVKEKKEKKKSITELRIENATKVLELLKTLGVEGKETTAVLSRAYNTFKGK